jgi:hypothetical protein
MRKILLIWFFWALPLWAAFEVQLLHPALIARGGLVSLHPESLNPAAAIEVSGIRLRLNYSNLFGIRELQSGALNLSWSRSQRRAIPLTVSYLGNDIYRECRMGLGYSQMLRKVIAVGATLNYYFVDIRDYSHAGTLALDVGLKFYISSFLRLALLYQNVSGATLYREPNNLPQSFSLGFQWLPHPRLELDGEIFKDALFPFATRVGVMISFLKGIQGLLGVQLNPDRFAAGINLDLKFLQFDIALLSHSALPYTYYFGCGLSF